MTTFKRYTGTDWEYINIPTFNSGPAATLAYAETTANQSGITTETDITGLTVTVTVPSGRRIKITGYTILASNVATDSIRTSIKEGATLLNFAEIKAAASGGGSGEVARAEAIISPSAGTHTYKLTLQRVSGTGNAQTIAGATFPNFILVEDVTGSTLPYNAASVPVGQLGYAEIIATTGTLGPAETDVPGLSVNISVPAGRVLKITSMAHARSSVAADVVYTRLNLDNADIGFAYTQEGATTSPASTGFLSSIVSPSAGAHTIKVRTARQAGSGNVTVYADTTSKSWLLVEDITPTPATGTGAPGSTLGYAEVVANQGTYTGVTDITGLSVSVTVPAGRRLRISTEGYVQSTVANDGVDWRIQEGATILQNGNVTVGVANLVENESVSVVVTPSAGTHTYKIASSRSTGSGNITMVAASQNPAFILVEDITGAIWPVGTAVTTGLITSEAWTNYVPVVNQGGVVTATVNYARYLKIGRQVTVAVDLSVTGVGGAGSIVSVSIPIVPFYTANMTSGVGTIFDLSASSWYPALSEVFSTTEIRFRPSNLNNNGRLGQATTNFSAALAAGDQIQFTITYEAAS